MVRKKRQGEKQGLNRRTALGLLAAGALGFRFNAWGGCLGLAE